MNEHLNLDQIHEMLDQVEVSLEFIRSWNSEVIDPWDIPNLIWLIDELASFVSVYSSDLPSQLKIPATTLHAFSYRSHRRSIATASAAVVAERVRSYLRSIESSAGTHSPIEPAEMQSSPKPELKSARSEIGNYIPAERWIFVRQDAANQEKIAAVATLLESVVLQVIHANVPDDEQILRDIERAQLIAILETALNMLRSPALESGLLRRAAERLRKAAEKSAEKQLQEGLGNSMQQLGEQLIELVQQLFGG